MPDEPSKHPRRARIIRGLFLCAALALLSAMLASWFWARLAPPPPGGPAGLAWALIAFPVMLVMSFWAYLALPAAAGLAASLLVRAMRSSIVFASCFLLTASPLAWSWTRPLPEADREPGPGSLTVFSANLLYGRSSVTELRSVVDAVNPDVIVLQEVDPGILLSLRSALEGEYPHVVAIPRRDAFGQATFSRLPMVRSPTTELEGQPLGVGGVPHIVVTIEHEGRMVEIHNVHTLPPVGARSLRLQDEHARAIASRSSEADAVILAGDFNCPPGGTVLSLLSREGFDNSHAAVGRGLGSTWPDPASRGLKASLGVRTRIDHVLWQGGLACTEQGVGSSIGSDHLPVWARFVWADTSAEPEAAIDR